MKQLLRYYNIASQLYVYWLVLYSFKHGGEELWFVNTLVLMVKVARKRAKKGRKEKAKERRKERRRDEWSI